MAVAGVVFRVVDVFSLWFPVSDQPALELSRAAPFAFAVRVWGYSAQVVRDTPYVSRTRWGYVVTGCEPMAEGFAMLDVAPNGSEVVALLVMLLLHHAAVVLVCPIKSVLSPS